MQARFLLFSEEACANQSVITSEAIDTRNALGNFSLEVVPTGSAPNVKAEYMVASSKDGDFVTPSAASAIDSSITTQDICGFDPALAPFMKIKITGNGPNGANTEVTARLMFDEITLNTL